jgi:parvulin-like peptidyl-prolyl isomerase
MLAREFSLDQSSAVKGGDLGFVPYAQRIDPEFTDAAYALAVGETSEPVQTSLGWHIIRNEEARDANIPEGDAARRFARSIVEQRKRFEAEREFWDELEAKANVQINARATDMLLEKLESLFPDTIGGAPRPDNYFPNVELLSAAQREMVFASYTGGEITVEDYISKISNIQEFYRPHFADHDSLATVVFQLEIKNIAEFEANDRKLGESEVYHDRVKQHREGVMVEKFRNTIISRDVSVDEEEIEAYYNAHVEDFMTPAEYHLQEIEHDSLEFLKDLLRQINTGTDFGLLAERHTTRPGYAKRQGDLGMVQSFKFPALYNAAKSLGIGEVSPVVPNARNRFSIVKLLDVKQPEIRPLEDCVLEIKQRIRRQKRDNATSEWLDSARSRASIEVFDDVIRGSIDESAHDED